MWFVCGVNATPPTPLLPRWLQPFTQRQTAMGPIVCADQWVPAGRHGAGLGILEGVLWRGGSAIVTPGVQIRNASGTVTQNPPPRTA